MNIPAAFNVKELFAIFCVLVFVPAVIVSIGPTFVFKIALFIFMPFLLIGLWVSLKYAHKKIIISDAKQNSRFLLIFKIAAVFLMMLLCYFAFGHGLLLYQTSSYFQNQPVITQFANMEQLSWAIALTLFIWIIASGLLLAMNAFDKHKISGFFPLRLRHSRYALVIDSVIGSAFSIGLSLFVSVVSVEISRTVVALAGFQWPIFPEVTAFILILALSASYYLFHIKARMKQLAKKSISIGRLIAMQTLCLVGILLIGQSIIAFFPQQLIMPLAKPIVNLLPNLSYENTWLLVTLTFALVSAPLVARLLARILTGLTIGKSALVLITPVLAGGGLIYYLGLGWKPNAYFVPIGIDNIVYSVGPAQVIVTTALILLLFCLVTSKSLQMAWVDIMPKHLGQRLRRLRSLLANETAFLMTCTSIYLFLANIGYYFIEILFLILMTLTLLWVSLYLFYTLTNCYKKAG